MKIELTEQEARMVVSAISEATVQRDEDAQTCINDDPDKAIDVDAGAEYARLANVIRAQLGSA